MKCYSCDYDCASFVKKRESEKKNPHYAATLKGNNKNNNPRGGKKAQTESIPAYV